MSRPSLLTHDLNDRDIATSTIDAHQQRHRVQNGVKPANEKGLCLECKRPIPAERLAVNPMAVTCVPCQELLEQLRDARRRLGAR